MLDGNLVRRRSIVSNYDGSPCARVGKRKHGAIRGPQHRVAGSDGDIMEESPAKACLIEKRSVASTSSYQFGGERMIKACNGLLERQSLEESCMIAAGEDISCMLLQFFLV